MLMNKKTVGLLLLFLAGILGIVGAFGHTLTSIPAIRGHFSYETDVYWFNRLTAGLILGTTGLHFGALMKWLGVIFVMQKDTGMRRAGLYVLLLSTLPHIVSFILLPLLTPQDASHMITHGLIIVLILLGLYLRK